MGETTVLVLPSPLGEMAGAVRDERRQRDEEVAALFAEHYRGLCRLAAMLLGDAAGAEEAVQEAFLRTFTGWWRIRHPERVASYLRVAVVNQCRSRVRRRVSEDRGNRAVWAATPEGSPGPDIERSADSAAVLHAVDALPRRQREAVVLHYFHDLPEAEVAELLGCAVGTVKSQLSKARASLGRVLDGDDAADTGTESAP
jgi:RNA polymerase sigma-70 factor (sigma-E family)